MTAQPKPTYHRNAASTERLISRRSCHTVRITVNTMNIRPGQDVAGCDMRNQDATGQNLACCNFLGTLLSEGNFEGADLREACMEDALCCAAIFLGADLRGTNMSRCDVTNSFFGSADFRKARLDGVNASRADFRGAVLRETSVEGANFTRAIFHAADLRAVTFKDATLIGADMLGADLRGADLSNANMDGTKFDEANLWGTAGLSEALREEHIARLRKSWEDADRKRISDG